MAIKKDIYNLAQSTEAEIKTVGEEIRLDLNLVPNPNLTNGTITGIVTDKETGLPIVGAVVKIMSSSYTPLAHVITGPDGSYIFSPFTPGNNYRVFASEAGYELATTSPFSLLANQTVNKALVATPDATLLKSFIAGDVYDEAGAPIFGSVVELYSVDAEQNETLVGIAFTNEYGQYSFRELDPSAYIVKFSSISYTPNTSYIDITDDSTIAKVDATMIADPQASMGTVSGIISDSAGAVVGADVILYRVEESGSLTPVAMTKTIEHGVYLFVNTPQGNYIVKSSKTVMA